MDLFIGFVALSFFNYYYCFYFFILIIFLVFVIFYFNIFLKFLFIIIFSFFFSPFLLSRVADRVLVVRPGVRPEPLRWESRVQDIGPPKTSQPHVMSIGKSSPRDLHLNAKTQLHSTANKLQC